jgi:hypothetical protein
MLGFGGHLARGPQTPATVAQPVDLDTDDGLEWLRMEETILFDLLCGCENEVYNIVAAHDRRGGAAWKAFAGVYYTQCTNVGHITLCSFGHVTYALER